MPGLSRGREKGDRQTGREDIVSKLRRAVGAYPQKFIISPRFLLKIYYKKRSWGRGVCPSLC